MEQSKSLGVNSVWEHPRERPERGEEPDIFQVKWIRFSNPTTRRLDGEWWGNYNWLQNDHKRIHLSSSHCTPSQTVHAERRIIFYSVEVHRRYQNNTHVTWCIVGKTYWWLLERGWRNRIVRCMGRLHKIRSIERKATRRINMVGEETDEETKSSIPDNVWPDMWKRMSDAAKRKQNKDGLSRNQSFIIPDNWGEYLHRTKRRRF